MGSYEEAGVGVEMKVGFGVGVSDGMEVPDWISDVIKIKTPNRITKPTIITIWVNPIWEEWTF